ncbi:MAG: hypothetical protein PHU85_15600, partial [Phycisphaerae bacterium]|nr:hypothetical protein [Phycisphaerae bacterium]
MNTQLSAATEPADMAKIRAWAGRFLSDPACLPTSFKRDGQVVRGLPSAFDPTSRRRRIDANIVETVFEGCDRKTGLAVRIECVQYADHPVVEWTAWLTNTSGQPTAILSDILALDGRFAGQGASICHCNGDFASGDGYTPAETPLPDGSQLAFAPVGGNPCDHAFPYFRIPFNDGGLTLAIGWPGQWAASFAGSADGVYVTAGQEKTHLRLMPGETIRTPRITVMAWAGNATRAVNLWRRWYRDHILPRPNGRPLQPQLAAAWTEPNCQEFTGATE